VAQGEVMPLGACGQQPTYPSQKYIGLVCSCALCARVNTIILFCSVWLELCIGLTSDLSENGRLTSGNQWEVTDYFFYRICLFRMERDRFPNCQGQNCTHE
jgi:hypothetical protein